MAYEQASQDSLLHPLLESLAASPSQAMTRHTEDVTQAQLP